MNGPMLALLLLNPDEAAAVPRLHAFAAAHPGVKIVTPHYPDEPWRAEIATGGVPGEGSRTSGVIGAAWPTGLLGKLERLFGEDEPDTG